MATKILGKTKPSLDFALQVWNGLEDICAPVILNSGIFAYNREAL